MSFYGQKQAEQQRHPGRAGTSPAPAATQRGSQHGQPSGGARPGDPRVDWAARLDYLASNAKLFSR
jgi:hypothetical protein